MGLLADKTVLITGGTSGIGLATAQRMVNEGAHVIITGRSQDKLDKTVAAVGPAVTGVRSDITSQADIDALAEIIRARGVGLDVVFANAGGGEFATLAESTRQHITDMFNHNVVGTLFTLQAVLPLLNEGASIVLTGSTGASAGAPATGAYAAAKAALRSFTRTWAAELVDRKVRVNIVTPGPVETPLLKGVASPGQEQTLVDSMAAAVPMKRIGQPEEVAAAVVFLASDQSSFMTGGEVFVDGGLRQI